VRQLGDLNESVCTVEASMEFNATLFAQYVILGVTNGALIALIALGYTSFTASSS
jgi:hypothetical protein